MTDLHALYIFRVVAPKGSEMNDGKIIESDIASKPVFWLAQPSPAYLCGQGRNLLVSWSLPQVASGLWTFHEPKLTFHHH